MPSITLMISEISADVRSIPPIASTARRTTVPLSNASARAFSTVRLASCVLAEDWGSWP
jgi:hypothetical protein